MQIIYLGHSGFLVRTGTADYLFDHIRGRLPEDLGQKPLYVFSSHFHEDHFSEKIFSIKGKRGDVLPERWILGSDIRVSRRKAWEKQPAHIRERIFWAEPGTVRISPEEKEDGPRTGGFLLRMLESTDSGVAFWLEESEGNIYHAGDLNWWHWEGEPDQDNEDMKVRYCREIDTLKGRTADAAFVTLDPRQEEAYGLGMEYFLKTVSCRHVFPMHFWKDYSVIDRFTAQYGYAGQICRIEKEGQHFEI